MLTPKHFEAIGSSQPEALEEAIRFMIAKMRHTPTGAMRGSRAQAEVAKSIFIICQAADWQGRMPDGLSELIRLGLDVPADTTSTTSGLGKTLSPEQRCAIGYLVEHPGLLDNPGRGVVATARHVRETVRGARTTPSTVSRWVNEPEKYPEFSESLNYHLEAVAARATRKKAGGTHAIWEAAQKKEKAARRLERSQEAYRAEALARTKAALQGTK